MSPPSAASTLQQAAYEALDFYFHAHKDDVLEIEILPPALEPAGSLLLCDGLNLGVPKKVLVLAYVEARRRFFNDANNTNKSSDALDATKVMLLFDPEHITATNLRKRRLILLEKSHGRDKGGIYHTALRQELCFLNSILTSPLHRQSKSPSLWSHREWMLDPLVAIGLEGASGDQIAAFWRAEIAAVCKSSERHPKNYYAWQYARRMIPRIDGSDNNDEFAYYVKDWCCKHPSDVSGWTYLYHLIPKLYPVQKRQDLLKDVIWYAINLRAEQESLWVFVRMALAQKQLFVDRVELRQLLYQHIRNLAHDDTGHTKTVSECVSRTLHWVETFGEPIVLR